MCSARVRSRARRPIRASSSSDRSIAPIASSASWATRISLPGVKKRSSPSQASDSTGVPHAAASNRRPDGQLPIAAIARRVAFNVSRDEQ